MKKTKSTDMLKRSPASYVPRDVALRVLTTAPKLSSKSRKRLKQALGKVVNIECAEPKTEQETYCRKLRGWTMVQLGRRANQNRARMRSLLARLTVAPTDKIRQSLEQALVLERYRADWIKDEIASRIKPVKPVVTAASIIITQEQIDAANAILTKQSP